MLNLTVWKKMKTLNAGQSFEAAPPVDPCVDTNLTHWLQLVRQSVSTADHRGSDLEPPVVHAFADAKGNHRKSNLIQSLSHFRSHWVTWEGGGGIRFRKSHN